MSQLTVTALQLGLLALLWVFVIAVVGVLRRDLFGSRVLPRSSVTGVGRRSRGGATPNAQSATPPAPAGPGSPSATVPAPEPAGRGAGSPATPPAPFHPDGSPARSLVVTEGPLAGTQLPLGPSPVTVGRAADCTLVIPDDYVSSHHARLVPSGPWWILEDLGSTNGTLLGRTAGQKVSAPVQLGAGSVFRIGRSVFEVRR